MGYRKEFKEKRTGLVRERERGGKNEREKKRVEKIIS